jgi:hypothetical protein
MVEGKSVAAGRSQPRSADPLQCCLDVRTAMRNRISMELLRGGHGRLVGYG